MDLDTLYKELLELASQKENASVQTVKPDSTAFQNPIRGTYYNSGDFSPNTATDKNHPNGHQGVDLRAAAGTAIYPVLPGTVTNVGTSSKGGNTVTVVHANGFRSYYAHCSTVKVQKGDKVNHDTVIATVGDSGNAKGTPPHLHFQLWKNEGLVNPASYISVPRFTKVNKDEKFWLSEKAKEEDKDFSMKSHLSSRQAFSQQVKKLASVIDLYYKLSI